MLDLAAFDAGTLKPSIGVEIEQSFAKKTAKSPTKRTPSIRFWLHRWSWNRKTPSSTMISRDF